MGKDVDFLNILNSNNLDTYRTHLIIGQEKKIIEEIKVENISLDAIEDEKIKRILKYSNEIQQNLHIIMKKYNHNMIKCFNVLKSFTSENNLYDFYNRGQLSSWTSSKKEAEYELQKKDNYYEYHSYNKRMMNIILDSSKFQTLQNIQEKIIIHDYTRFIEKLSAYLKPNGMKLEYINMLYSTLFYLNILDIINQFNDLETDEVSEEQRMLLLYLQEEVLTKISLENNWDILSETDINNFLEKKKAKANASRKSRFEDKSEDLQGTHKLMRSFNIGKLLKKEDVEDMLDKEQEYQNGDLVAEEKIQHEELEIESDIIFDFQEIEIGNVLDDKDADEYDGW